METAIKKAIEGGWNPTAYPDKIGEPVVKDLSKLTPEVMKDLVQFLVGTWGERAYLDPLFWQALGKAEGWSRWHDIEYDDDGMVPTEEWKYHWHRFIDWIAEGKETDLFFKELLKV